MDLEIKQIYDFLVDVNYPVTLEDLKNPTSEYMVKIALTFLSGQSIDGKLIQRTTFEQEQSLSYPEVFHDIISLINLHEVMMKIGKRIFIKDFYLTDMTCPGAKKARRLLRTLLNFVLYAVNKMDHLAEPIDAIFTRLNTLNAHVEKKNKDIESWKETVLENSKKTALKEKYHKQLEDVKSKFNQNDKNIAIMEERVQTAKQVNQLAQQKNGSIRQQLLKINEKIAEMESTIVKSPEEYEAQLTNYAQDCAERKEKLQTMVDKLRDKRKLKNQFEKVKDFVAQEYDKFSQVQDTHKKSKMLAKAKVEVARQLTEVQVVLQKLHDELANSKDVNECDTAKFDEIHAQCQEHVASYREMHKKILSETRGLQQQFEAAQIRYQQARDEKEELNKKITSLENVTAKFLKDCQNLYTNEIQNEIEIEKLWKSKHR